MQAIIDPTSPRHQLTFAELPRGVVKFPPHIVAAIAKERARFAPEVFTEEYARQSLEQHTLNWYYAGLPVAYRALPDGIDVLGMGWEETEPFWPVSPDSAVKLVQP